MSEPRPLTDGKSILGQLRPVGFALHVGVVVALAFAAVETVLVYGSGRLHSTDVGVIAASDVIVWTAWSAVLALFGVPCCRLRREGYLWITVGVAVGPLAVLTLRRPFLAHVPGERPGVAAFAACVGLLLAIVVALRTRLIGGDKRWATIASVAPLLMGATLILPSVRQAAQFHARQPMIDVAQGLLLFCASSALAVLLLRSRRHGHASVGVAAVSAGLMVVVGVSARPRSDVSPVRLPSQSVGSGVLVVTVDTLRADYVSCYGYPRRTTPRVDGLAQRAIRFANAYTTAPYTLASHASLFTGLLPSEHGARPIPYTEGNAILGAPVDYPLRPDASTLAEELRGRGYRTAAIVANNAYLDTWTGLDRGFSHYEAHSGRTYGYVPLVVPLARRLVPQLATRLLITAPPSATTITDEALAWLREHGDEPFFLFLNYLDPHLPYEPPSAFADRFPPVDPWKEIRLDQPAVEAINSGRRPLDAAERRFLVARYEAEINFADFEVGRLLDEMETMGLFERTVIIITSDHGELLGEHGLVGHGATLYEEVLRVPLVVKPPWREAGSIIEERTSLADVRMIVRSLLDGSELSLAPSWRPRVLAENWTHIWNRQAGDAQLSTPSLRAVYAGPWKLVQMETGGAQLFNLDEDANESHDLADTDAGRERKATMLTSVPRFGALAFGTAAPLDAAAAERLRALGYVY